MTIGSNVRVSGQIRLTRGSIDVQGKPFEIEKGTVTFVEAGSEQSAGRPDSGWRRPTDACLRRLRRAAQDWKGDAAIGAGAAAERDSRAHSVRHHRRPEQRRTQQASTMAAAAGGVATQPLNQALGGVNHALDKLGLAGGISTKVDTSTPNPRPEVEVQIARDVSLQVAWVWARHRQAPIPTRPS